METNKDKLDEELYSRQLYVIGHESMRKMMKSKVLIIGLDGLGQEVAKNICLAGIQTVSLLDTSPVKPTDLGSGYYFRNENLSQCKADACVKHLKTLNKYVNVGVVQPDVDVKLYDVVISVNNKVEYNKELNKICHANNIKFIISNVSGLFGEVFCDFVSHKIYDKDGQLPCSGLINDITENGIMTLANGSKHTLQDGDHVKVGGTIYEVAVLSRAQIKLHNYKVSHFDEYEQVKQPSVMEFTDFETALTNPKIVDCDFSSSEKNLAIHKLFNEKHTFNRMNTEYNGIGNQFKDTLGVLITPMCSIIGGFTAQEVIKATTGKFMPVDQFYYFDASDLPVEIPGNEVPEVRYHDMTKLFGSDGLRKLMGAKLFLVGSGAIGCENLKNFVTCGIGAVGKITVTDMDSIEQSNLNRQFLFKEKDVSKMKSISAAANVLELNQDYPSDSIISLTDPVGGSTEHIFTDKFISNQDIISNALDNVEARNYMDQRCIKLRKPLVDAGTLGTKGHVQVVIPFVSESYSSSTDPTETSIPLCTIKSYPYNLDHCIEWALAEFKLHFNENVEILMNYTPGTEDDDSTRDILNKVPRNKLDCIERALSLFYDLFTGSISKLLELFPEDHLTDDGMLFWSPPKKMPKIVVFDENDKTHLTFIHNCANLFAESHVLDKTTMDECIMYLTNKITNDERCSNDAPIPKSNLIPLEFDKDSWHADFIYSASNLRARNYRIKEASKHHIRGIAGKIIPAIATTTAIVSGLCTLEIIRYILSNKSIIIPEEWENLVCSSSLSSEKFKNTYLDLAIPFLAQTDLVAPRTNFFESNGHKLKFNLWSRMEFKDMPLGEILAQLTDIAKIDILYLESKIVYWRIYKKYEVNLSKKVSELFQKKKDQKLVYLDVLTDCDADFVSVAVML